ncbi:DUF6222 family protein [Amycolatopsis sp. NPDC005003]
MTASEGVEPTRPGSQPALVPPVIAPESSPVRPMPRLGRGVVWSDIVAEIEHDHRVRARDAA